MKRKPPVMRNIGLEQDARALEDFSCAYPKRYRYRYDYEQQDHVELIGTLKSLPCAVMLSGYPSILYEELLSDWQRLELQVMNQAGVITEVVWYNFPIDRLH